MARLLAAPPTSSGGSACARCPHWTAATRPLSYHCGSVWPHDTAIALLGLTAVRGGHRRRRVWSSRLLGAAEAFDYRLPELYGGDAATDLGRPVPHPAACRPQAWAAAAAVSVLQATLGLTVDVPRGEVRVRPLPVLGAVEVAGLQIAGQRVGVSVDRDGTARASGLPAHLRWFGTDRSEPAALLDPTATH